MKKQVLKLVAIFIALVIVGNISAQEIGVNPVSFNESVATCDGIVNTTLTIENISGGDLDFNLVKYSFDSTGTKYYSLAGEITVHEFPKVSTIADTLFVIVTLNGDYDGSHEYAELIIDGENLGQIEDKNISNGTDIVVTYAFVGNDVVNWLSDGQVTVELDNSSGVGASGSTLNQVQLLIKEAGWINLSTTTGTIVSGNSTNIDVEFNANGINVGAYTTEILINSNDPVNPEIIVPCKFTISGSPAVGLSESNIDFANVFVNGTKTDTLVISNTGCDTLFVTNIASSLAEYTVDETILTVLPFDSTEVLVTFIPTSLNTFNSILTIYSNDANATVDLIGNGIAAPELSLSLSELSPIVTQCYDAITQQYTINNTGNAEMTFEHSILAYGFDASKAGNVIDKFTNNYSYYGIVWVGNYLYGTNGSSLHKYDTSTQSYNSYTIHTNARGVAYDGEYLWIGNNTGTVSNYDLMGNAIGESFQLPFSDYSSLTWDGEYFIAASYNYNATIYKLNKDGSVIESYATNTNMYLYSLAYAQNHGDGKLWANTNNSEIIQLSLVGSEYQKVNTLNYTKDNYNASNLAYDGCNFWNLNWNYNLCQIDDGILDSEIWISPSDTSGFVNANSSQNIDITFSALNLNAGVYN